VKTGLEFVNILHFLAKLAWWQLSLGAEKWTCLKEWLTRWDAGPVWHPESPTTEGRANTWRETPQGSELEHLNSFQEVLGLEQCLRAR
jgi:hypothetical protein